MSESGVVREINSRGLLVRLLTYAIRCPDVSRTAVQQLQPMHFDEATQLDFFMVWFVAQQILMKSGAEPHQQHLKDLVVNIMISEGYTDTNLHAAAMNLIDEVYSFREDPWNVTYGMELLNAHFESVFRHDLMRVAQRSLGRNEALDNLIQSHQRLNVDENKPFDPFDLEKEPVLSVREPTGAGYFDLITGGGSTQCEVYGVLGPSGGGKTLLAMDVSCCMAERGKLVHYFSYEQPPQELQQRLFSRVANIDVNDIRNREWADIPEDLRDRIVQASAKVKGNLIMHDRSSTGDNLADVTNIVRESISRGRKPDLIVIDWLWPLVLRMTNQGRQQTQERILLQRATDDIKSIASKYKVCILVLNQLSTEMAKKGARKKPEWFNSAEAGSFAWLMHFCIAIGTQDEQGFCWLVGSKARNNAKSAFVVQCKGAFNKFVLPSNSMIYDDNRKEFVDSDDMNRMPGREKKQGGSSDADDDNKLELNGGLV